MQLLLYLKDLLKKAYLATPLSNEWFVSKVNSLIWYARFHRWLRSHPCRAFVKRSELREYLVESFIKDAAVDFFEFGVFEGITFRWFALHNQRRESRFMGFDTFTGLPEQWEWATKGTFSTGGAVPVMDDARCLFVKGLFQDSLPAFLRTFMPQHRKLVHLDADLYSSTLFVLITMGPTLKPGDILLFDELSSYLHEFRAFWDFLSVFPVKYELIGMSRENTQVALRII
jgi:O-methyltransferase